MGIGDRYQRVLHDIAESAHRCGRDPSEILLVAVSKGHAWAKAAEAFNQGCLDFGENRVQEALPKIFEAPASIRWHMIGTLQKNKVRKVISQFHLIHSVDSLDLAEKIAEVSTEEGIISRVLLEVHLSGESTKKGLSPIDWLKDFDRMMELQGLEIQGLMTMAPFVEDESTIRRCFAGLREFRDVLNQRIRDKPKLTELSMGMSHDYRWAIQEGATMVRIGTAIFGV